RPRLAPEPAAPLSVAGAHFANRERAMSIRRAGLFLAILAFVSPTLRAAEPADPVAKAVAALYDGIREETLPNGLRVVFKPIPDAPTVTVMTAYRVGSGDEELTQTGLSHYLEHLMFKGT